jgi:hypothetical protein
MVTGKVIRAKLERFKEIIEAWLQGYSIERLRASGGWTVCNSVDCLMTLDGVCAFRIKKETPESKYAPFDTVKEIENILLARVHRKNESSIYIVIGGYLDTTKRLMVILSDGSRPSSQILQEYIFADTGNPFGRLKERG